MQNNNTVKPTVLISILNWNNASVTKRCIESLSVTGYLADPRMSVILIDNGSESADAESARLLANSYKVNFRQNPTNTGFAGGHNAILKYAIEQDIPFVWLLNNDALVQDGMLDILLDIMQKNPDCGASSPCLAFEDTKKICASGAVQDWSMLASNWCSSPADQEFYNRYENNLWLVGTALLLRTQALKEVGLLDENLFAYCEDDDIGERLRIGKWKSIVARDSIILHGDEPKGDVKRPAYFYYLTERNHITFYKKYTPVKYRRLLNLRLFCKAVHRSDIIRNDGYPVLASAVLAGLQDGMQGKLGKPRTEYSISAINRVLIRFSRSINYFHNLLKKLS